MATTLITGCRCLGEKCSQVVCLTLLVPGPVWFASRERLAFNPRFALAWWHAYELCCSQKSLFRGLGFHYFLLFHPDSNGGRRNIGSEWRLAGGADRRHQLAS